MRWVPLLFVWQKPSAVKGEPVHAKFEETLVISGSGPNGASNLLGLLGLLGWEGCSHRMVGRVTGVGDGGFVYSSPLTDQPETVFFWFPSFRD